MSTFNQTSSYNRTYEKKIIEETPRIRISNLQQTSPFGSTHHIIPPSFPSFPTSASFGGNVSSIHVTDDTLSATMDVSQYKAEDLKLSRQFSKIFLTLQITNHVDFGTVPEWIYFSGVSVVGNKIVVEGKHPEIADEFGTIERHFIRKFNLPRGVEPEGVSSNLTNDGILTIQALPLRPKDGSPARAIPIKIISGKTDGTASPAQDGKAEEKK
ncbi:unnamed protein product [Cylicocyclus nassatus]|uniref:SHSP domain-containing protein n=1 Tax=Cylicocyclus nassatus TaxID=53992 RepID=A0AA36M9X9_CYLNA|nr:unnamed protein product [Cylicocyclus nassatus]